MHQKSILFITTADTDILTADRALAALPAGFPRVDAVNPSNRPHPHPLPGGEGNKDGSLPPGEGTDGEIMAFASNAGVVVLRLLGEEARYAGHLRRAGAPLPQRGASLSSPAPATRSGTRTWSPPAPSRR